MQLSPETGGAARSQFYFESELIQQTFSGTHLDQGTANFL